MTQAAAAAGLSGRTLSRGARASSLPWSLVVTGTLSATCNCRNHSTTLWCDGVSSILHSTCMRVARQPECQADRARAPISDTSPVQCAIQRKSTGAARVTCSACAVE
jgi:hypothetical protein